MQVSKSLQVYVYKWNRLQKYLWGWDQNLGVYQYLNRDARFSFYDGLYLLSQPQLQERRKTMIVIYFTPRI